MLHTIMHAAVCIYPALRYPLTRYSVACARIARVTQARRGQPALHLAIRRKVYVEKKFE